MLEGDARLLLRARIQSTGRGAGWKGLALRCARRIASPELASGRLGLEGDRATRV